jgi:predicted dehydrogenase
MSNRPIQAGIVGAGLMGRWHAHAAQKAGARISAVVDPDNRAAIRLAKRYGGMAFAGVEEMLIARRPDVIHICSPKSTHYRIAQLALKAECHLLIEKPMASTASETESIFKLSDERELKVSPVHQFLFQDGVLKAKRLLPQLGHLVDITAVVMSAGGSGMSDSVLHDIAMDILPHPLSLMQFFLSGFANVSWSLLSSRPGELRAVGDAAGTTLSLFISMNSRPTANYLELRGERGTIYINLFHGYSFIERGKVSRRIKVTQPFQHSFKNSASAAVNLGRRLLSREPAYPGLQRLVRSFYGALRHNTLPPISVMDAIELARVRDHLMDQNALAVTSSLFR